MEFGWRSNLKLTLLFCFLDVLIVIVNPSFSMPCCYKINVKGSRTQSCARLLAALSV